MVHIKKKILTTTTKRWRHCSLLCVLGTMRDAGNRHNLSSGEPEVSNQVATNEGPCLPTLQGRAELFPEPLASLQGWPLTHHYSYRHRYPNGHCRPKAKATLSISSTGSRLCLSSRLSHIHWGLLKRKAGRISHLAGRCGN